jgi:hypothetical protein
MMKAQSLLRDIPLTLVAGALLLVQGCGGPGTPWHCYPQRSPVRVAVMPSDNKMERRDASVVFNTKVHVRGTSRRLSPAPVATTVPAEGGLKKSWTHAPYSIRPSFLPGH